MTKDDIMTKWILAAILTLILLIFCFGCAAKEPSYSSEYQRGYWDGWYDGIVFKEKIQQQKSFQQKETERRLAEIDVENEDIFHDNANH